MCKAYCKKFYDRDGIQFFNFQCTRKGMLHAILHAILSGVEDDVVRIWVNGMTDTAIEMAHEEEMKEMEEKKWNLNE